MFCYIVIAIGLYGASKILQVCVSAKWFLNGRFHKTAETSGMGTKTHQLFVRRFNVSNGWQFIGSPLKFILYHVTFVVPRRSPAKMVIVFIFSLIQTRKAFSIL